MNRKTARDLFLEEQRGKSVSEAASVGVTDEGVFSSDAPIAEIPGEAPTRIQ